MRERESLPPRDHYYESCWVFTAHTHSWHYSITTQQTVFEKNACSILFTNHASTPHTYTHTHNSTHHVARTNTAPQSFTLILVSHIYINTHISIVLNPHASLGKHTKKQTNKSTHNHITFAASLYYIFLHLIYIWVCSVCKLCFFVHYFTLQELVVSLLVLLCPHIAHELSLSSSVKRAVSLHVLRVFTYTDTHTHTRTRVISIMFEYTQLRNKTTMCACILRYFKMYYFLLIHTDNKYAHNTTPKSPCWISSFLRIYFSFHPCTHTFLYSCSITHICGWRSINSVEICVCVCLCVCCTPLPTHPLFSLLSETYTDILC
jgi:hypothetical protein